MKTPTCGPASSGWPQQATPSHRLPRLSSSASLPPAGLRTS